MIYIPTIYIQSPFEKILILIFIIVRYNILNILNIYHIYCRFHISNSCQLDLIIFIPKKKKTLPRKITSSLKIISSIKSRESNGFPIPVSSNFSSSPSTNRTEKLFATRNLAASSFAQLRPTYVAYINAKSFVSQFNFTSLVCSSNKRDRVTRTATAREGRKMADNEVAHAIPSNVHSKWIGVSPSTRPPRYRFR